MAMSFLPMILMFLGTTGGMNELLDLTDPRSYLEAQGIEYRVEAMLEVLAEPASKDLDAVKAQEVKKLQAMRALGALADKAALPALQKAAGEKTLFFDDYASAAIAAIEGKEFTPPGASAEDLKSDLALLPEGIGLVVQAHLDAGGELDLRKVVTEFLKAMPDGPDPAEVFKELNAELAKVLGKVGNVRLDAVTLGLSAHIDDDAGFVVIIARGKYDHRTIESVLAEMFRTESHEIGGTMFLGMDGDDFAIAPVSSELLVMVAGPGWEQFPLAQVAARLKTRPAENTFGEDLKKLIARADQGGPIWGAAIVPEKMKEVPQFAPFDELVLSTRELQGEGQGKVLLKLDGTGTDAAAVKASAAEMEQAVGQGIVELEEQGDPGTAPILKLMKGMKFSVKEAAASISMEFDGNPANMLSLMMPMLQMRNARPSPPPPTP